MIVLGDVANDPHSQDESYHEFFEFFDEVNRLLAKLHEMKLIEADRGLEGEEQ